MEIIKNKVRLFATGDCDFSFDLVKRSRKVFYIAFNAPLLRSHLTIVTKDWSGDKRIVKVSIRREKRR